MKLNIKLLQISESYKTVRINFGYSSYILLDDCLNSRLLPKYSGHHGSTSIRIPLFPSCHPVYHHTGRVGQLAEHRDREHLVVHLECYHEVHCSYYPLHVTLPEAFAGHLVDYKVVHTRASVLVVVVLLATALFQTPMVLDEWTYLVFLFVVMLEY